MPLDDLLRHLEARLRGAAEAPLEDAGDVHTLRRRVLDEVDALATRRLDQDAHGPLTVYLFAPEESVRVRLETELLQDGLLVREIQRRLREAGLAAVDRIAVNAEVAGAADLSGPAGEVLRAKGYHVAWPPAAAPAPPALPEAGAGPQPAQTVHLTVEQGTAEAPHYTFEERPALFLGRLSEVVNEQGRLVRRNDVAFLDTADPANATVSRAHAHLRREDDGGYRIYDDGSAAGTSLFREGQPGLVPVRRRGVRLEAGDLIYLGQACLRYELS